MLAGSAGRFDKGGLHVVEGNLAQIDLLSAEAIEYRADQVVLRDGTASTLANGFANLFVHMGYLHERDLYYSCVRAKLAPSISQVATAALVCLFPLGLKIVPK